ncbi:hypothetical protein ACFLYW_03415, partial [Thermodesulfobacteriota bacterium]
SWTLRHFAAESFCNTVPNSTLVRDRNPSSREIMGAIGWDRYNAEYWYKLAQARARESAEAVIGLAGVTEPLERAVLLNPFAPVYFLKLGWAYTRRGHEPDFAEKWLPKADRAMDLAGLYSGARDPGLQQDVADYWLMRSMTLKPDTEPWDAAFEKTGKHYRSALDLETGKKRKKLLDEIRRFIGEYYPDEEMFERIVRSEG